MVARRPLPFAAACLLALLAIASCGADTPVPSDARPENLRPIASSTTVAPGPPVEPGRLGLLVTSPDVDGSGHLSPDQALDPPRLLIEGVPASTVELAVMAADVDRDRIHWLVTGLDAATTAIDGRDLPPEAIEFQNESGEFGWLPVAVWPARLRVSVLALDSSPAVQTSDASATLDALETQVIDRASLLLRVEDAG